MTTPPTLDSHGDETHPSFAVARINRRSSSGAVRLFDSSIGHREFVHLEIARATRKRDLHRDWIYGSPSTLIEVNMSLTQWGALVSSFGQGAGTPVTLSSLGNLPVPECDHESRLAITAREVQAATSAATQDITAAVNAVQVAFTAKAGRREMADVIGSLVSTVRNLPSNMKFAANSLTEHAEDVVAKAKADIEATQQFDGQSLLAGHRLPEITDGAV